MLSPFLDAPLAIQLHIIAAIEALILGPFVLYRRRRDRLHKIMGYIWVTNMFLAASSSMFIHTIRVMGPFSPIHLLSIWTLYNLWASIDAARRSHMHAHRTIMIWLYWGGLVTAGFLSMIPGRIMSVTLFSLTTVNSAIVIVVLIGALAFLARLQFRGYAGAVPFGRTSDYRAKSKTVEQG